jgi:RNA polymerase-interacting CarD/CdnL/TRCF family regulator
MFKNKKIALPIPLRRWYHNLDDVSRLREILSDEVFQRAVATLKENASPTVSTLSSDAQANNNKTVWLAGYCDFVKDLEKLTNAPAQNNQQNNIEEWT